MKFRYKRYGPGILRPVIPIQLQYRGRSVDYEVLVDSGADSCIFDAGIAEILGIDLESGEPGRVGGITGAVEPYYIHPVTIVVGGWPHNIRAGFIRNIARGGYGIVGQNGFFDIFILKFDLLKEELELKERQ